MLPRLWATITGRAFSMSTFLTNWAKVSPEAKQVLFARIGPKYNADMDAIARVASNVRDGSRVFANPSGTSQAAAQAGAVTAAATSMLLGRLDVTAGVIGAAGGANLLGRLMTNPDAVRWLAQTTKVPPGAYPAMINQLARSSDPDLQEMARLLQQDVEQ